MRVARQSRQSKTVKKIECHGKKLNKILFLGKDTTVKTVDLLNFYINFIYIEEGGGYRYRINNRETTVLTVLVGGSGRG